MPSTASSGLRLEKQAAGENQGTWGIRANSNVIDLIDAAITGATTITDVGGARTLSTNNYAADEARMMAIRCTATLTGNLSIIIPALTKFYIVSNETAGAFTVSFTTESGTTAAIPQGSVGIIFCDGINVSLASVPVFRSTGLPAPTADIATGGIDAITEIATALKTGADGKLVTGTAGSNGRFVKWDANGDAVDGGVAGTLSALDGIFLTQDAYDALTPVTDTLYLTTGA